MKPKNMKKGRVIEHKESGAIAIVLNELDDGVELLFQNPSVNPHDSGYATYILNSWEAEEYRLINRPVVGVVYMVESELVASCDSIKENGDNFLGCNSIEYIYSLDGMPALAFV